MIEYAQKKLLNDENIPLLKENMYYLFVALWLKSDGWFFCFFFIFRSFIKEDLAYL